MSGNNLVVGARRCRGGHTTRPRIHSPPKGPLTKWHNHRKQKPPSSSSIKSPQKESIKRRRQFENNSFCWASVLCMSYCHDTTQHAFHMSKRKNGAQFESAPKKFHNNSVICCDSWCQRVGVLLKSVTESPEMRNWLTCGRCTTVVTCCVVVLTTVTRRLRRHEAAARKSPSTEEIVSREAD